MKRNPETQKSRKRSTPAGQEGEKGWAFPDEGRPIPHLALEDGVSGEVGEDRALCLMAAIGRPAGWMSSSGGALLLPASSSVPSPWVGLPL